MSSQGCSAGTSRDGYCSLIPGCFHLTADVVHTMRIRQHSVRTPWTCTNTTASAGTMYSVDLSRLSSTNKKECPTSRGDAPTHCAQSASRRFLLGSVHFASQVDSGRSGKAAREQLISLRLAAEIDKSENSKELGNGEPTSQPTNNPTSLSWDNHATARLTVEGRGPGHLDLSQRIERQIARCGAAGGQG